MIVTFTGPLRALMKVGIDTSIILPSIAPDGMEYIVLDDLRLGNSVVLNGAFGDGSSSYTISGGPGWLQRFTWTGDFYAVG